MFCSNVLNVLESLPEEGLVTRTAKLIDDQGVH